ncbi:MAG TPA: response regulator [Chitinophagales bacterium]|nr:response regulator [Chitinophagales bacterium]
MAAVRLNDLNLASPISYTENLQMVLLAEDDDDDKEFIKLAFEKASATHRLHIADNGQEALNYLLPLPENDLPCLIVLDLNMPVLNGLQTLEALNKIPKFQKIPVVIFSTSDSIEDKNRCLSKGAADYLVKPSNMTEIVESVNSMLRYCG